MRSSTISRAAARWIADGNVSFDDCEAFTSSFGLDPAARGARRRGVASTSFMFMFVEVPEPVWKTSTGNWSAYSPATISVAAGPMGLGRLRRR